MQETMYLTLLKSFLIINIHDQASNENAFWYISYDVSNISTL